MKFVQFANLKPTSDTPLDILMWDLEKADSNSYAVKTYKKFRVAADKTLKSILISVNASRLFGKGLRCDFCKLGNMRAG